MNFIIKSPREVDYIVDAPLVCPLLPKHLKAKLHDYPTSYWYKNETELSLDEDNLEYKTSPVLGGMHVIQHIEMPDEKFETHGVVDSVKYVAFRQPWGIHKDTMCQIFQKTLGIMTHTHTLESYPWRYGVNLGDAKIEWG